MSLAIIHDAWPIAVISNFGLRKEESENEQQVLVLAFGI
jgi:hypothetical protein